MTGDLRKFALVALVATGVAVVGIAHCRSAGARQGRRKKSSAQGAGSRSRRRPGGQDAPAKKKRQDPAEAQRAIEAAAKLLETGKADPAVHALTAVLAGGNLPPAIMAKALFYRGIAYRQQKKPAQAIADLTSALWLKGGLGEVDRGDAMKQRSAAYQEAGLADAGEPIPPAVPGPARATRTASADPPASPPPQSQSSGSWLNPFAGWFGSSSPPPPAPAAAPQTTASIGSSQPSPGETSAPPGPRASGWSSRTEVRGTSQAAAIPVAAAKPEGKFRIQVGMLRSESDAQALSAKIKREHVSALESREPEIDETVVGNMGSFYRVRFGPFASAQEGQAACAKLKGTGIDCLVVTQ